MRLTRHSFRDANGHLWTVNQRPAALRGDRVRTVLEFTSDTGEVRVTEVLGLDGRAWNTVHTSAWRAMLAHAQVIRRAPVPGRETDIA